MYFVSATGPRGASRDALFSKIPGMQTMNNYEATEFGDMDEEQTLSYARQ